MHLLIEKITMQESKKIKSLKKEIEKFRKIQSTLCDYERIELWDQIREGYCLHCGTKLKSGEYCYCTCED